MIAFLFQADNAGLGCPVVLFVAIAVIVAYQWVQQQNVKAARDAYRSSLSRLKKNPTNAELRGQTLELGRKYSNLTRNRKGVTIFDEVALKNDIDAACAGAVYNHPQNVLGVDSRSVTEGTSHKSVAERLQSL